MNTVMNRREFLRLAAASPALFLPFVANHAADQPHSGFEKIGFGVAVPWHLGQVDPAFYDRVLTALRPPWWHNWLFDQIERPGYIPTFWQPEKGNLWDQAVAAANAYPDRHWLLYNAPERGNLNDPVVAATMVRDWVSDTHGRFGIGGTLVSVHGAVWLDRYLQAGGPLPAWWHCHIYGFADAADWADSLLRGDFLNWYLRLGINRPIVISETNANRNATAQAQALLMAEIWNMVEQIPYVIGVGWYSAYDVFETWPWSNLVDREGNPTQLGEYYRDAFGLEPDARA